MCTVQKRNFPEDLFKSFEVILALKVPFVIMQGCLLRTSSNNPLYKLKTEWFLNLRSFALQDKKARNKL